MAKGSVKNVKIFLSATTREFGDDRADLASRVTRDNVEVKTQVGEPPLSNEAPSD